MSDKDSVSTASGGAKTAGWAPKVFVAAGTIAAVSIGFGVWATTSPNNSADTQTSAPATPASVNPSQPANQPSASPVLAVDPDTNSQQGGEQLPTDSGSRQPAGTLWPAPALHTGTPLVDQGNPLSSSGGGAWSSPQDYANYQGGYPNAPVIQGSGGSNNQANSGNASNGQSSGNGNSTGDNGNHSGTGSNNGQGQGNGVDGNQGNGQGNVPAPENNESVTPPENPVPIRPMPPTPPADGQQGIRSPKVEAFEVDPRTKQVVTFDESLAEQGSKYPWVPNPEAQKRYEDLLKGHWEWVPVQHANGSMELQSLWVGSEAQAVSIWIFPSPSTDRLMWGLSEQDLSYALYMWELWTQQGEPLTTPAEEAPTEENPTEETPTAEETPAAQETPETPQPTETSAEDNSATETQTTPETTESPAEENTTEETPATEQTTETTETPTEDNPTTETPTIGDRFPKCEDLAQPYSVDCLDGDVIVIAHPQLDNSISADFPVLPTGPEVLPALPPANEYPGVPSCSAVPNDFQGECLDDYGAIMFVEAPPAESAEEAAPSTTEQSSAAEETPEIQTAEATEEPTTEPS